MTMAAPAIAWPTPVFSTGHYTRRTERRAPLGALRDWVAREPDQRKGEFVLLVRGAEEAPDRSLEDARALAEALLEHLPASKAAAVAARYHGARRKDVYRALTGER